MVLLTALVSFVAVVASFGIDKQLKRLLRAVPAARDRHARHLLALDFFLFYIFWEVMLLPMYFLIGIWGGPRKEYAAIKFFLYTLAGSVLMLLAIIALYYNSDADHARRRHAGRAHVRHDRSSPTPTTAPPRALTLLGFDFSKRRLGRALHRLRHQDPDVPVPHLAARRARRGADGDRVILAGVLLKMGTYGILRINFAHPARGDAVGGARRWRCSAPSTSSTARFCAMAQKDLKKLVAYSSVSHMGFCLLGMAAFTPTGSTARMLQMFNHGTITAMLFLLVGVHLRPRPHARDRPASAASATQMPHYTAFFGFAFMASLGLPGLSGFIGEVLVFLGAFPRLPRASSRPRADRRHRHRRLPPLGAAAHATSAAGTRRWRDRVASSPT